MDQVAFVDILTPTQPGAPHAATVEHMGEAALDHLTALAHGVPADAGFQSRPVGVDSLTRRLVAVPAQIAVGGLGLGDPRFPDAAIEVFQTLA